jgi:Uma2 family endonuclease
LNCLPSNRPFSKPTTKKYPAASTVTSKVAIGSLLDSQYDAQFGIFSELDLSFASGKTRPDLCIFPKTIFDWTTDEIVVTDVPLTTIEILSPMQSISELLDRVYTRHFPAGVKSVWLVVPPLELVTIFWPDRSKTNFITGPILDPATGIQIVLEEIFS